MNKIIISISAVVIIGGIVAGALVYSNNKNDTKDTAQVTAPEVGGYKLNLTSGDKYVPAEPVKLNYTIKEQDGKVLKDFDVVHEKKMHLIVVRKDRTNFQHVHPALDETSGNFQLSDFRFPTDGDYRIFADFTPANAKKDAMGMKEAVTPYQDVQVGDVSKYTPQRIGSDKLSSSANGFDTALFFPPSDDSAGGTINKDFTSGNESVVPIEINKAGQPYTNLQPYLGALGHMVVLGPNLEFIHAHPQSEATDTQSGLITFSVTFPDPGQYKLYLQTQAENQVNTTDYTLSVKPGTAGNNQSMPGMDHSGH